MKEKLDTKKTFNYENIDEVLLNREVYVVMKNGTAFNGDIRFLDEYICVVVNEPKSTFDIETQIVHSILAREEICSIQFKTPREKK